jgi:hypothetical protein
VTWVARPLSKKEQFFPLLEQHADKLASAAEMLDELLQGGPRSACFWASPTEAAAATSLDPSEQVGIATGMHFGPARGTSCRFLNFPYNRLRSCPEIVLGHMRRERVQATSNAGHSHVRSNTWKKCAMSKKSAEHHKKASEHHTHAAHHHVEAAKHYEGGDHEKAAHHAHTARGHATHAAHHSEEAVKAHAEEHGQK